MRGEMHVDMCIDICRDVCMGMCTVFIGRRVYGDVYRIYRPKVDEWNTVLAELQMYRDRCHLRVRACVRACVRA